MYLMDVMNKAKLKPKLGEYFYIIKDGKKYLRKIQWIGVNLFEWNYGWGYIGDLVLNNQKSKVKFILQV